MGNKPAKTVSEKKKNGLLRSTVGGIAKAGGATVKGTAKVAGKSINSLEIKGTYAMGKTTTKATIQWQPRRHMQRANQQSTHRENIKVYITMKYGKTFVLRQEIYRNVQMRRSGYRRRMVGFKVSIFISKLSWQQMVPLPWRNPMDGCCIRCCAKFDSGGCQTICIKKAKSDGFYNVGLANPSSTGIWWHPFI